MSTPLARYSVVDELAGVLRVQILDGALAPGARLREVELASGYDVSRHTLRAALRQLAAEGLVRIEPQRGASVARLEVDALVDLFAFRTALEIEAAHRALQFGDGKLPETVHRALDRLVTASAKARPSAQALGEAHAALHGSLVAASQSPRIVAAYATLAGEMRMFLMQLRPVWSFAKMGTHHIELIAGLESRGTQALREHLDEGRDAVLTDIRASASDPA
jgi:DNA-binding GntR family transcriptional regulator